MKAPLRFLLAVLSFASLALSAMHGADAAGASLPRKKVLYFSKMSVAPQSHGVALRRDGQPSLSESVLTELGAKHDLEFTFSKDGSLFSDAYLAQFDAASIASGR
jgi:uncharacterized protein